jgi:diadenosine tetraphosphate (Ap4A) HIT family hydrolase
MMQTVHEAKHFTIVVIDHPHVSRRDGGHLVINPKIPVEDRTKLTREQAVELMKLTMVGGEAMKTVLTRRGIAIGRINYQDNGNWRHELHVHLYGRARDATLQPYGHSLAFPPTRQAFMAQMGDLEPLDADDVAELRAEIVRLLATAKYREF